MGALFYAVGKAHADVTRTLINNGADINAVDDVSYIRLLLVLTFIIGRMDTFT